MVGFLGMVETAHQKCDAMAVRAWRKRGRFLQRKTQSAFARVDMQRATALPSMRPDKKVPLGHFDGTIDDGSCVDFREGLLRSRVQPAENINRCGWRNSANTLGFRNIGDEKYSARSEERR